jgi:hypothetical protein
MLGTALEDVGPWAYIIGNFALHYYPSLHAVARYTGPTDQPIRGDAAALLAVYCLFVNPAAVYGCAMLSGWAIAPVGVGAALLLEAWVV